MGERPAGALLKRLGETPVKNSLRKEKRSRRINGKSGNVTACGPHTVKGVCYMGGY